MQHEPTIDVIRELASSGVKGNMPIRIALLVIAASDDPISVGHVAARAGLSRSSITSISNALVSQKLVRRMPYEYGDMRSVYVELTQLGRKAIQRAQRQAGIDSVA